MLHFPDAADKPWLVERLPNPHDHIGLASLQALCRIDPKSAIGNLHLVSRRDLALGRDWWFPELAVHDAAAAGRKLREMMRESEGPWDIAICYEGYEHLLEPESLELLLDQLVQDLEGCIGKSAADRDRLYRELTLLTSMNTLWQLEGLRKRQGTALEANLEKFLGEIGAQKHDARDSLVRDPAMEILYRIGGANFTSVANDFIASESQYGRHEGLEYAIKRPDDSTFDLCAAHVLRDDTWNGGKNPVEQNDAAACSVSAQMRLSTS